MATLAKEEKVEEQKKETRRDTHYKEMHSKAKDNDVDFDYIEDCQTGTQNHHFL